MHVVDDPLLALILRFVLDADASPNTNQEFLQVQLSAMKCHLAQFPAEDQGAKAMEWIERHAKNYRQSWQRREASRRTFYLRCVDCPLAGLGVADHCEIHEQWLFLLRRCTSGELPSDGFVEQSLELLRAAKDQLRARTEVIPPQEALVSSTSGSKGGKKKGKRKNKKRRKGDA